MNAILHKWHKNFLVFLLGLMAPAMVAQQVTVSHKAGWFYIPDSLSLHIKGGLSSLEGNEEPLLNLGQMYISDSISCYGDNKIFGATPDTATANIYLNGDTTQVMSGNTTMRFGNLYVQNTYDTIEFRNDVEIYNFIDLQQGNVYVHDFKTLDLINTGVLIGERNKARVFGGNYGELKISRPLLFGRKYSDIGGIGFGLTVNGNLGISTEITRKNVSQLNVSNGSIERFYSFKPEKSAYVSNPEINYLDSAELNDNAEENLEFYISHTEGNTWTRFGGVVDTLADVITSATSEPFVLSKQTMLSIAESKCLIAPYLEFELDTIPLCGGSPAWLHPMGITGMSSVWSTGDENKDSIQVDAPGLYIVTITDVKGCTTVDSVVVILAAMPETSFSIDPVCVGSLSEFDNLSTISSGTMTYSWELGDLYTKEEDTSTLINPVLTYQNQGQFHVKLTVTSNYGCVSENVEIAHVNAYPIVAFSMLNDCADSLVQFGNLTKVYPDTTIDYTWQFGDESISNDSTPLHAYPTAAGYQVKLTANALGCESVLTQELIIHPNPVAQFLADDVCLGEEIQFDNQSTVPSTENSYLWQFEENSTAVIEDPNYAFEKAGNYAVSLTATTNEGCMHDTIVNVSVHALPTPQFIASETCDSKAMYFTNTGSNSSSFEWDFNEEGTEDTFEAEFTFASHGAKQVVLTETDSNGCVASINKEITVKAMPQAAFITTNGCQDEELSFLNNSAIPEGDMNYEWYVNDDLVDDNTNFSEAFTQAGDYTIKLIAKSDGCVDSVENTSTIYPTAQLDLGSFISTCANDYLLDAQNEGSTYSWSNASTNQQLNVKNDGSYWVKVTTENQCVTRDTVIVDLNSVVQPQLGPDDTFCDEVELNAGYPGAEFLWSTGETTQTIMVSETNSYWVHVTDQNGCSGSDTIVANIVASVVPDLGNDQELCEGEIITLKSGSENHTYQWNTGATTATIDVNRSSNYWVQIRDNNGCVSRDTVKVIVHENPSLDLGADMNYCDAAVFDISGEELAYSWDNGALDAQRTIYESGQYWAIVTDQATACSTRDTVNLTVSASPVVELGHDYYLCNGSSVVLDAANAGSVYAWNIDANTQSIVASASGYYSVDVSSPEGCVTSDTIVVNIADPLDTYLGEDFVLCSNTEAVVSSPLDGAASYEWKLNDSALNLNQQSITVRESGTLTVTAYTYTGCTVTDTIELLESNIELHANYLVATSNIYVGDTLQFINLSAPEPYSSYWEYGDGYFSSHDSPDHIYYFKGEYRAMLEISNEVCTDTISKLIEVLPIRPPEVEVIEGVNEILTINAYPNPTSDQLNLDISLKQDDEVIIECINVYGIHIFSDSQNGASINTNYQVSNFMPGIYFLQVRIPNQTMYIKFIKN